MEGFIDLLFDDDGLVIVDYKTDSVGEIDVEKVKADHEIQAGLYALAVHEITGKPIRQVVLLFLQPKAEYVFTDIDRLVARGREAAARDFAHTMGGQIK